MAHGRPPLTDILIYHLPTFSPEIDAIVVEIDGLGGFKSPFAAFALLALQGQITTLRSEGKAVNADTLLHNLGWFLEREREWLAGR
jgi:hypothetical protein